MRKKKAKALRYLSENRAHYKLLKKHYKKLSPAQRETV